jgi:prepilin-type N-terminal cleavage/methylation domain-containing protein
MFLTTPSRPTRRAFTLVELLVVIGIIALLVAILMPSLSKARKQADTVKCMSNMRQVGLALVQYANTNRGILFPKGLGAGLPRERRWPMAVFTPAEWNPPILTCPSDFEPVEEHSYVLNDYLSDYHVRYHNTNVNGLNPSQIIVMGEKVSSENHYYMDPEMGDYMQIVEFWRHGLRLGSNYLYMDMHVETTPELKAKFGIDPWAVAADQPPTPPAGS